MKNVTLNQLRAFRAIVRLGSFRAAASHLHLSQPSISQRMRELESELGIGLFVRSGPKIALTAEGHALIGYADRMLATSEELANRFRSGDPLAGTLRIGLSETFALVCLGELLRRLEKNYPAIKASMFIGDSGEITRKLRDRELEVAIVAHASVPDYITQVPVGFSRLGWIAAPGLRVGRRPLTPAEIASHHLMIGPASSSMYTTIGRWFVSEGVTPPRVSTCNNVAVTMQVVRAGAAIGLLPLRLAEEEMRKDNVKVLRVVPPIPAHSVSICYQASEEGPGLHGFIGALKAIIAEYRVFTEHPE